jgi:hypothetical protein
MSINNNLREVLASIVREQLAEMLGTTARVETPETYAERLMAEDDSAAAARVQRPKLARTDGRNVAVRATVARAPRTGTRYGVSKYAGTKAGQDVLAKLTPRLATTFKAIQRARKPLSNNELATMLGVSGKVMENNVFQLGPSRLRLIERIAAE